MQHLLSTATLALFASAVLMQGSLIAQETATPPKQATAASSDKKQETAAPPQSVKLKDISGHIGKVVMVEFEVKNSKLLDDKKICFLNSLKNYRDKDSFTVIIKGDTLELFTKAKILDPAKHFLGKKIRVRGKVVEHRSKPQIAVTKVDQIKILATAATKDDSPKDAKVATNGEDTKTE